MRLPILLFLFEAIICCQALCQSTVIVNAKDLRFVLRVDTVESDYSDICSVGEIKIYKPKGNALVQIIQPGDNEHGCGFSKNGIFVVEDMNFDGHDDFRLFEFLPAGPNIPYLYWLYDSKTSLFKSDTALAQITSPEFDKDRKLITSSWRNGCCEHGVDYYRYNKSELILYERRVAGHDENDEEYSELWTLENGVLTKKKN